MSKSIYSYTHNANDPITKSGSYQLFPTIYLLGIASSGGGEAVFSGNNVDASISFAPALINAINPYIVQSENGANVTIDVGSSLIGLLTGSSFIADGGTINISGSGGISALSGSTYTIKNNGTINMGSIDGSTNVITALSGSGVSFGDGGGTLVINPNSNLSLLTLENISGFGKSGATIEIPGASKVTNSTYDGTNTSITFDTGLTLKINGDYTSKDNSLYEEKYGNNLYISATSQNSLGKSAVLVCFLAGSLITTASGAVTVEALNIGDEIIAYVNGVATPRRVTWAGQAHCNVRSHLPDDEAGYPVRLLKDAISDGVPFKDMLITAEHCLFFDGQFVPARMLVNGRSIFFDKSITSYDYYHIETEDHSVIMADGVLTESYLDTGNRRTFSLKGNVASIGGSRNLSWDDAAAPLTICREMIEPLFRKIEKRADEVDFAVQTEARALTNDSDLHLTTDTGTVIRPARQNNGRVMFMIPSGVESVRIVSNASRPCDVIGPFVDDRRQLGVLVGMVTLFESNRTRTLIDHLCDAQLSGWNNVEEGTMRWTSGNAFLSLGERAPGTLALMAIEVRAAGPYILDETISEHQVMKA
ncbi:Hint domain-containing protein [Gluconobacter sphaericus]|uniref:Hint domain-containing protein n=1 Tax=Gluconobacter sphaericus TaxID=574987 RepID=UPI001B8AA9C5|nr:Hint domain-containing protein [Gluconobacter sphaericus]MBS1098679.1 Hint domain-containing protein [Gluconobacter sphaericus]